MEIKEAIRELEKALDLPFESDISDEVIEIAIRALEMLHMCEKGYLDEAENPLEPLKIINALKAEVVSLNHRKESKPQTVSILDYTIIEALKECFRSRMRDDYVAMEIIMDTIKSN